MEMDPEFKLWRLLETDWYSPRRLLSSPIDYDFPVYYNSLVFRFFFNFDFLVLRFFLFIGDFDSAVTW